MPSSRDPVIRMFHCLYIVLKIPLFSTPSSHDPVTRMFHCLLIVLKIPLFFMPSSHDPVMKMFHCLFIVLKITLFSISMFSTDLKTKKLSSFTVIHSVTFPVQCFDQRPHLSRSSRTPYLSQRTNTFLSFSFKDVSQNRCTFLGAWFIFHLNI